ncbi:DUF1349 domain-containing protein [Micromonospora sp. NBC_01813]|uniref:DUF1349 domain-containing protein n=1 Tax=Micromonospora sp. NBC_01813 TaxID=2975988 RepID=UPI002DD992A9|nr:DUF1349 domain-containing protein [Micromonospora sp. NBC_01813]WSA06218.1 DUF1349 domain-containing protein [Micromonospora sp. NBC_01813]
MTDHAPPQPPAIAGLPVLGWQHPPVTAGYDAQSQVLSITAGASTDWFVDPVGEYRTHNAPALVFDCPDGEFALSARVTVDFGAAFDAGVLCLRIDEEHWAKLCFEYSPQREPMVVSVVTNGASDDANGMPVEASTVHLRLLRKGAAYAFHYSLDGTYWHFARLFRLPGVGVTPAGGPTRVGFLAQSPTGDACTVTFDQISLVDGVPDDLRDGR